MKNDNVNENNERKMMTKWLMIMKEGRNRIVWNNDEYER